MRLLAAACVVAAAQVILTNVPAPPPALPSNPSPADGATGVSITALLSWTGGLGSTSYVVRLGSCAQDPLPIVSPGQTQASYQTSTANSTTYCWQITDKNASGNNTGPIWRFTTVAGGGGGGGTLVQQANFVLVGEFRMPSGTFGPDGDSWAYGGEGLTYDPSAGQFGGLISTTGIGRRLGELLLTNPATWTTTTDINSTPILAMTQAPQYFLVDDDNYANDAALINGAGDGTIWHGTCHLWAGNNKLYCTDTLFYDGNNDQGFSMFTRSLNFNGGPSFSGWIKTNNNFEHLAAGGGPSQHPTSGYIANIPVAFQASLGKALVGSGGNAIVGGTSNGPAAFLFDPDTVAFGQTIQTTGVLWYSDGGAVNHPTIGEWGPPNSDCATCVSQPSTGPYKWTGAAQARGAAVPTGWRSLLVTGRGTGNFCYGYPTGDPAQEGQTAPNGIESYCYDTEDNGSSSVGVHSNQRDAHLWAYDLDDLIAVKNGTKNPYDPVPYSHWSLVLPTSTTGGAGVCTGIPGVGRSSNSPIGMAVGTIGGQEYIFISFATADYSDIFACRAMIGAYKVQ